MYTSTMFLREKNLIWLKMHLNCRYLIHFNNNDVFKILFSSKWFVNKPIKNNIKKVFLENIFKILNLPTL
jgi:hypothetical protein